MFLPVERLTYRLTGVNPEGEQRWTVYAVSLLAFLPGLRPGPLRHAAPPGPRRSTPTIWATCRRPLSLNTAVSFLTNTNWQNYAGEDTMAQFTQMAGLVVEMFTSAAAGIAVAVALIRGLTRKPAPATLGNFWVDLIRIITRILFPMAVIPAIIFIAQGAEQNLHATHAHHHPHRSAPGPAPAVPRPPRRPSSRWEPTAVATSTRTPPTPSRTRPA